MSENKNYRLDNCIAVMHAMMQVHTSYTAGLLTTMLTTVLLISHLRHILQSDIRALL